MRVGLNFIGIPPDKSVQIPKEKTVLRTALHKYTVWGRHTLARTQIENWRSRGKNDDAWSKTHHIDGIKAHQNKRDFKMYKMSMRFEITG